MGKAFSESVEGARRARELVRRWNQVCTSYTSNFNTFHCVRTLARDVGLVGPRSTLTPAEQR